MTKYPVFGFDAIVEDYKDVKGLFFNKFFASMKSVTIIENLTHLLEHNYVDDVKILVPTTITVEAIVSIARKC